MELGFDAVVYLIKGYHDDCSSQEKVLAFIDKNNLF